MMIPLGFEIETGRRVSIPLAHLAVTGQTQASGKTTTLEGLISRSGLRAVAFVTKRGEGSFRTARLIPPYFRETFEDRPMWEFVESVLEAAMKQRLKFERQWIIEACRNARTLKEVHAFVLQQITPVAARRRAAKKAKKRGQQAEPDEMKSPARGLSYGVYTCLNAYFDKVIPQIERLPYVDRMDLQPGLNVMDLSDYSSELQALVIRSALEWVYQHERDTVVIIPEAWEFIPQDRGSPVRLAAEELIRKGAALRNYVWIDSQDLAGVHKVILRQVGVWIVGVQREANEIARVLRHLLPKPARPAPEAIMQLGRGEFLACFGKDQFHVYVQPAWVPDVHAQAIAKGIESVESAERIWKESQGERKHHAQEDTRNRVPVTESGGSEEYRRGDHAIPAADQPGHRDSGLVDADSQEESHEETEEVADAAAADDPLPDPETGDIPPHCEGGGECHQCGLPCGYSYSDHSGPHKCAEEHEWESVNPAEDADLAEEAIAAALSGGRFVEDEAMWKEKYEALEKEVARLRAELAGQPFKRADRLEAPKKDHEILLSPGVPQSLGGIYDYVKQRAAADPGILELLTARPELRIKVERTVIQMDGATLEGRIALLLHEGFCDKGATGEALVREVKRRGYGKLEGRAVGMFYMKLAKFAEQGFLTVETENGTGPKAVYSIVPEMKKSIVRG